MLGFLFRGLTASASRGAALFEALTRKARERHWYVEGGVPDTIDGRFSVLSTVVAMALVRLEAEGAAGNELSVALTERFVEVMECEHRELGLGDPGLGKTVRKLVGMLSRRTGLWRSAWTGDVSWSEATRESLYRGGTEQSALDQSAAALARLRTELDQVRLAPLGQGKI